MIIETFKFIYVNNIIGYFNTQDINSFAMLYDTLEYGMSTIKTVSLDTCDAKKNKHFDFFLRLGYQFQFVDDSQCELYINDELTALNLKDIADKYTNAIHCEDRLYIFGTSLCKRELNKHLRIKPLPNYPQLSPNMIKVASLQGLENYLKSENLDKPYFDVVSNKGLKLRVDIIVRVAGLCNYGVLFDSIYAECNPFFDFMLKYKRMLVFDSSTKLHYLITIDNDINTSKLMFIEKGEV